MYAVTAEMVAAYASWFVHCWEYYAVQQQDGSYRPAYQPLTLSRIADHLMGRYTLGTYAQDRAGFCSWVVCDADQADGLERLVRLAGELAAQAIPSVLEASRRGGHLWVFFTSPVLAAAARAWVLPYAHRYGVEVYPKQDRVAAGGVGSLIRLPLGVHRVSGGWYPFLALGGNGLLPAGETVAACCAWIAQTAERVEVPDVLGDGRGEQGVARSESGVLVRGSIRRWCRAQDIVEVIGQYTHLDQQGRGRCPLPGHHRRGDVRPSFQVFGGDDPHWYCYTWGRAGDLFDFLCVYHGWSRRVTWGRIQQGLV